MQDTLCQITAQVYENYGNVTIHDVCHERWKAKGGQIFEVMVDADDFFYSEDMCVETIKELLADKSNFHCKYEYVSHELIFCTPIKLNSAQFELVFDKHIANKFK